MKREVNPAVLVVLGIVLVAGLVFYFWRANQPHETIKRFQDIPPKGAGKYDRGK